MNWIVPRIWEGEDVWILGGGPSVPRQFGIPEKVIQDVMKGTSPPSVYSPYMKAIHNKHVIGINVAFLIGDWFDIVFFGDNSFILNYGELLANYPGLRVSCSPILSTTEVPWIKILLKDTEHPKGITKNPSKVSWNHNSGSASISLAAHTGAKRIILLGFDMNLNENKNQHWHDIYKRGQIISDKDTRKWASTFERHLTGFTHIAKDAKEQGIEIINASPTSDIQEFPKISLQDIL